MGTIIVSSAGVEPAPCCLEDSCPIQLSYEDIESRTRVELVFMVLQTMSFPEQRLEIGDKSVGGNTMFQQLMKKVFGTPTDEDLKADREKVERLKKKLQDLDTDITKGEKELSDLNEEENHLIRERSELLGNNRLKVV